MRVGRSPPPPAAVSEPLTIHHNIFPVIFTVTFTVTINKCRVAMISRALLNTRFVSARSLRPLLLVTDREMLQRRCLSGFSLMSPKTLSEIIHMDVFLEESDDRIREIWSEYENTRSGLVHGHLKLSADELMRNRGKDSPFFVFPIFKGEGQYFTLLSQFQENMFVLTYLEEYKRNPETAPPWIQLTLYNDLAAERGLCLYRADYVPQLSSAECKRLVRMIFHAYEDDHLYHEHVSTFNKKPHMFDFEVFSESIKKIE